MSAWPVVALEDVFVVARGGSPRPIDSFITDDPNGVNWIMIGDASEGSKYISSTRKRIIKEGVKKSRMVSAGDFLLTNSMSFGKPYILKTSGCIHDGWLVLSPLHDQIHSDFFYYLLGSQLVYSNFKKLAAGAVVKNLNSELVRGVQIPLPPLAEQKRIAAILDAADALRTKRREALAQLDALLQSTFLTLFGDPVANPMGWKNPPLLELCSAKQWPTISGTQLESSGYPVYGANGQIGYYSKYNHEHPTVLVTCRGATCGTINICPPKCYVTGNAMALDDPDPKRITLSYLEWVLRIRGMNDVICGAAQPQITRTGMAPITIPLPPLHLQQKFAAIVESVERQKSTQRAHLAELDALFAGLQHRAFRGEL